MVWVESRWIGVAGKLLEVRANKAGIISDLVLRARPVDAGAEREEGAFSVVVPLKETRSRRLPSLYVGNYQVHAARNLDEVLARLARSIEAAIESETDWVYVARACEIGGRKGLYCHDFFNRSPFTRKLKRAGMTFSEDAYVYLMPNARFCSLDWKPFKPEFVILGSLDPDEEIIHEASRAWLAFNTGGLRVGKVSSEEFSVLLQALDSAEAVGSSNPALVLSHLKVS